MSYSLWGAIAETHWWLYVIFIWLAFASFNATKPRQISMKLSIIHPMILAGILLIMLPFVIKLNVYKISILIFAITPGLVFGYLQFHFQKIKAIKNTARFYVPGSWTVFIVLMILLMVKLYYYNYPIILDLSIMQQENTSRIIVLLLGFLIGINIARSLCLYRCMKVGPFK